MVVNKLTYYIQLLVAGLYSMLYYIPWSRCQSLPPPPLNRAPDSGGGGCMGGGGAWGVLDLYNAVCLRIYVVRWVWILLGGLCRKVNLDMGMDKMVSGFCYGYGYRGIYMV